MSKGPFDSIWEEADRRCAAYAESTATWKAQRDEAVEALETTRRRIEVMAEAYDMADPQVASDIRSLLRPPDPQTTLELLDAFERLGTTLHDSEGGRLLRKLRAALEEKA